MIFSKWFISFDNAEFLLKNSIKGIAKKQKNWYNYLYVVNKAGFTTEVNCFGKKFIYINMITFIRRKDK